jgi:hypothetical protein
MSQIQINIKQNTKLAAEEIKQIFDLPEAKGVASFSFISPVIGEVDENCGYIKLKMEDEQLFQDPLLFEAWAEKAKKEYGINISKISWIDWLGMKTQDKFPTQIIKIS